MGFVQPLSMAIVGKRRFRPGDTIQGTVSRDLHFVDSDTTLTVKLTGCAKVKIIHRSGGHGPNDVPQYTVYSSCFDLWNESVPGTAVTLYRGPIHIPPQCTEPLVWPFAVTIPEALHPDVILQEHSSGSFLNPGDPETLRLPGSFVLDVAHEAFVGYRIQAILRDSKGHEIRSNIDIHVDGPSSPFPITDFGLRSTQSRTQTMSSHRLDPAFADGRLSFGQKAQHLFGSSKVPTLFLQINTLTPSVLQLDNPHRIPFQVKGTMIREKTDEALWDVPLYLVITRFELRLYATTNVRTADTNGRHDSFGKSSWKIVDYVSKKSRRASRSPSPSPSVPNISAKNRFRSEESASKGESYADPPPPDADALILPMDSAPFHLDLGQALDVTMPSFVENKLVSTTFNTFNINTSHKLAWNIRVEAGGRDSNFAGNHPVSIMPPSEDTAYPEVPTSDPLHIFPAQGEVTIHR